MTLFENIKRLAKLRGMNIKQVSVRSGLSENAIYGWKKHTPTKGAILAVANTLNTTYEELTGEKETSEPTKIDLAAAMNDDHAIMTYQGRPIPEEDLEYIKRILNGGKGRNNKNGKG